MANPSDQDRKKKLRVIKKQNAKKFRQLNRNNKRRVSEAEYLTTMRDASNVLEIDDLHTFFYTDIGTVRAVDGVSINIPRGKTVGVVGESGCGKSVTSLSVLRLLQEPQGQIAGGELRFNDQKKNRVVNLAKAPVGVMNKIRGEEITMIFQEPMTSLNPVFRVGMQLDEVLKYHNDEKLSAKQMAKRSVEMLELVGIANAEGVYKMYPHELSGGMRQRVVIAMALACNPQLIIADEPTTALDVTIQAQILDLLRDLKDKISASIMLITHDLGVVAEMADYVMVMYAGRVVEEGTAREIFHNPSHPYTIGLMNSRPTAFGEDERLYSIPGNVPNPIELPDYCYFRNRCDRSVKMCRGKYPPLISLSPTHKVACYRHMQQKGGDTNG
ncbi:ABC transporter ATP-binding protein [Ruminococcaceae bacterium OttesenSCG-928-D13]|nr:ABC transporter ATP-binding protein [Ruminococcaceae bacterium OttesenSCG-928-D13]